MTLVRAWHKPSCRRIHGLQGVRKVLCPFWYTSIIIWLNADSCGSFSALIARYTARYALHVGALARTMTVKDVACSERLHHSTVKGLDKLYMAEQLRRHPMPSTTAIGVDEIAIRKGHEYRVVVGDLERQRPIWFGGTGRKQEDLAQFFAAYGARRCAGIRVAVNVALIYGPWTCGNRFAKRHRNTPHRPRSCSTNSTSCAT